jgi:protein-L-isoaspartate(D-aspartate) O-methyltransferase
VSRFLQHEDEAERTTTDMDPRVVVDADPGADLAISALVPCVRRHLGLDETGGSGEATLWLVETAPGAITDGSWAVVEYAPGLEEYQVEQYGPRRLWDEVSSAYRWWLTRGRPGRHRYGYTVADDGQHIWLDYPDSPLGHSDLGSLSP